MNRHLANYPDDADAMMLLAQACDRVGQRGKAASLLARCVEMAPDFIRARVEYAKLLRRLHRYGAALEQADLLLKQDRRNPLFRQLKAGLLDSMEESEQSLVIWQELAVENPQRALCWINYGNALRAVGSQQKCVEAYRTAIECQPSLGLAWWSLAYLKTFRFGEDDIEIMRELLKGDSLTADDRINLLFALGKAYEDIAAYDRSFEHYAKGNAARRLRVGHDPDSLARAFSNEELFTPAFLQARESTGCTARDPIFILGQPRSGSTLIEQILSSHPLVEGTAELPYIGDLVRRLREGECAASATDYPQILAKLEPDVFRSMGEEYLERSRAHRKTSRPFFVDKSPQNYFHLGLIHLILPNAKIIDARRHPAACCLSIFKHNRIKNNLRLGELGHVYRDYVALMEHFDRVLPGRVHRLLYEAMVADPETEIRRLLDYLGLPFEEKCLRFYDTARTIRTPSSEQVRRPISAEGVDHWRHFEPWLAPLLKSLGPVLSEYPSVPGNLL